MIRSTSHLYFNSVLLFARSRGLDISAALSAIGLTHYQKDKPERLALSDYAALLAYCAERLDDPLFGFHLGQDIRTADFGVLGYLIETGGNLREAIDALLRYDSLVADIGEVAFIQREEESIIRWRPYSPTNTHVILRNMTAWVATARQLLAPELSPSILTLTGHFNHQALEALHLWFACPIQIGQSHNELRFPSEFLDLSIATVNPQMHANLRLLSEQALHSRLALGTELSRIQQMLQAKHNLGHCTLESLASALNLSPRSLQRRLKQEQTSFSQVLDNERKRRAPDLLTMGSLGWVAENLGFNEQSSFNRAFRRWFACSPSEYKKQKPTKI